MCQIRDITDQRWYTSLTTNPVGEHCSKAITENKLTSVDGGEFHGGLVASGLPPGRQGTAHRDKLR